MQIWKLWKRWQRLLQKRNLVFMNNKYNLTTGSVSKCLLQFAMPYLLACFLQTFYGMADLFVVGLYHGASTTAAVSVGSQVIHMLTVIVAGFAMGTTVRLGRAVGAQEPHEASRTVGTATLMFLALAALLTMILVSLTSGIVDVMMTPVEARQETISYLRICFLGVPFIVAYNVLSSIFRGAGDSRGPLGFVGIACAINVALDFLLVGGFHLGAVGAALAIVIGQAVSSAVAIVMLLKRDMGFVVAKSDFRWDRGVAREMLWVGGPIALQDGLIQVSFIVITIIANSRGLILATGVGIVEKIIGFLFLVPSAFLSAISAITAQNVGAGKPERANRTLWIGMAITVSYGFIVALFNQFSPGTLVGLFTREQGVYLAGCEYMRSYVWDVMFASIHFCFSGYFCGRQKSLVSFVHNIISIILIRIPGAYLASVWFPHTLYPMGWAAPIGSILSAIICAGVYWYGILRPNLSAMKTERKTDE